MIVAWKLMERMVESDVETVLQKTHEKYPDTKPHVILDNGPRFIANDFKIFTRQREMRHVTTSLYYPQSNGKLERFHGTLKTECIRKEVLTDLEQAKNKLQGYIDYYNNERLHSAIGYVTPRDKLQGRDLEIIETRKEKLHQAAKLRHDAKEKLEFE